jgi:alpha-tubulin suppressor-like RCC1 family protein
MRWITPAGLLLPILLVNSCTSELAPSSTVTVTLQQTTPWPDTLVTGEIATVQASIRGANGADIVGVALQWSSSDSAVLQVTSPDSGRQAIISTHATGTATITAHLDRPGFTPKDLPVPIVVRQGTWPALLTVGAEDTVAVALSGADQAVLGQVSYAWQSNDPAVLQASAVAADSSRALFTARSSGAVGVTVTMTGPRIGHVTFQQGLNVGNVQIIAQPAWPALLPVTGTAQLVVAVKDAAGNPLPGAQVHWSSTNLSAFTVDSTGAVMALSRGTGEVVASVGVPPFQIAELRAPLVVVELWGKVSAGDAHTCAVTATDGTGYCWGDNTSGQLGLAVDGSPAKTRPSRIVTFHKFTDIQAGASHSCGREGVDNLLCWGLRDHAQLGDGLCPLDASDFSIICAASAPVPVTIVDAGILNGQRVAVNQIATGGSLTCMVNGLYIRNSAPDDIGLCWGNRNGPMGNPLPQFDSTAALAQAEPIVYETPVIAAGGSEACIYGRGFSGTFEVMCAGLNDAGQLGDGTTTDRSTWSDVLRFDSPTLGIPQGLSPGASVGGKHACALLGNAVWCWGSNSNGQLGANATSTCGPSNDLPAATPCSLFAIPVQLPVNAVAVVAGGAHTCALTAAGDAWCWGDNSHGQLGRDTIGGSSQTPALVIGGLKFASISTGGAHTCGVTLDHVIYCWGANASGQLGDGTQTDGDGPTRVAESPQ